MNCKKNYNFPQQLLVDLIAAKKLTLNKYTGIRRSKYHLETFLRKSELETNSKLHYYQ